LNLFEKRSLSEAPSTDLPPYKLLTKLNNLTEENHEMKGLFAPLFVFCQTAVI
jgi:hypothetical protein